MNGSKTVNYKTVLLYVAQIQHLLGQDKKPKDFITLDNIRKQVLSMPSFEKPGIIFYSVLDDPSQMIFTIKTCTVYPAGVLETINKLYSLNKILQRDLDTENK